MKIKFKVLTKEESRKIVGGEMQPTTTRHSAGGGKSLIDDRGGWTGNLGY